MLGDADIEEMRAAGWDDMAIYAATALIASDNFSGRLEAASGLPMDEVPERVRPPEASAESTA